MPALRPAKVLSNTSHPISVQTSCQSVRAKYDSNAQMHQYVHHALKRPWWEPWTGIAHDFVCLPRHTVNNCSWKPQLLQTALSLGVPLSLEDFPWHAAESWNIFSPNMSRPQTEEVISVLASICFLPYSIFTYRMNLFCCPPRRKDLDPTQPNNKIHKAGTTLGRRHRCTWYYLLVLWLPWVAGLGDQV